MLVADHHLQPSEAEPFPPILPWVPTPTITVIQSQSWAREP